MVRIMVMLFMSVIILILPLFSAVTLSNGTILKALSSNITLTFSSYNAQADSVVVESSNITLNNVSCNSKSYLSLFFNLTNMVNDSYDYCYSPSADSGNTGRGGSQENIKNQTAEILSFKEKSQVFVSKYFIILVPFGIISFIWLAKFFGDKI